MAGFTLVEMLVAMVLTLLIMASVATLFSNISDSMSESRASIEMADRLRGAENLLQSDLMGVTVTMDPPRDPAHGEGYFEYIEGVIGPIVRPGLRDGGDPTKSELEVAGLVAPTEEFDEDGNELPDTTVGDNDDILMFTTRNLSQPFIGRFNGDSIDSPVAEVIWFVRGTTLYRRVMLVEPSRSGQLPTAATAGDFYLENDISVRLEGNHTWQTQALGAAPPAAYLAANSLGDLTKRENRFGHQPFAFPHDARFWGRLGMPLIQETAHTQWPFPDLNGGGFRDPDSPIYTGVKMIIPDGTNGLTTPPRGPTAAPSSETRIVDLANNVDGNDDGTFDAWFTPHPWDETDQETGTLKDYIDLTLPNRAGEDVVLQNVLAFDVKIWDPGAPVVDDGSGNAIEPGDPGYASRRNGGNPKVLSYGAYVDLNYMGRWAPGEINTYESNALASSSIPGPRFHRNGDSRSRLAGTPPKIALNLVDNERVACVYDTWSTHYERDGFDQDQDGTIDEASNGFDDNDAGGVDDESEYEAPPPYPHPARGIRVTIRVFEPDSREIREVVVEQEFLPQ